MLMQPKGEPEMSMKQLQETYDGIMMPAPAVVTEEAKPADTGGCAGDGRRRAVMRSRGLRPLSCGTAP